jgi:hypothetical protein
VREYSHRHPHVPNISKRIQPILPPSRQHPRQLCMLPIVPLLSLNRRSPHYRRLHDRRRSGHGRRRSGDWRGSECGEWVVGSVGCGLGDERGGSGLGEKVLLLGVGLLLCIGLLVRVGLLLLLLLKHGVVLSLLFSLRIEGRVSLGRGGEREGRTWRWYSIICC